MTRYSCNDEYTNVIDSQVVGTMRKEQHPRCFILLPASGATKDSILYAKNEEVETTEVDLIETISSTISHTNASTAPSKAQSALVPSQFDVLLGRGQRIHNHVGNLFLRTMVQELKAEYDDSPRNDKTQMTLRVVQEVKFIFGGRFLKKQSNGEWVEVGEDEARLKVAHTFRNLSSGRITFQMSGGKKIGHHKQSQRIDARAMPRLVRSETFGRAFYPLE